MSRKCVGVVVGTSWVILLGIIIMRVREEALILHSNGMSMRAIPIIGIITNTYNEITNYLVPGSILNYIQDSVTSVNVNVNVGLEMIAIILWIMIPSVISYVIVKKRDM